MTSRPAVITRRPMFSMKTLFEDRQRMDFYFASLPGKLQSQYAYHKERLPDLAASQIQRAFRACSILKGLKRLLESNVYEKNMVLENWRASLHEVTNSHKHISHVVWIYLFYLCSCLTDPLSLGPLLSHMRRRVSLHCGWTLWFRYFIHRRRRKKQRINAIKHYHRSVFRRVWVRWFKFGMQQKFRSHVERKAVLSVLQRQWKKWIAFVESRRHKAVLNAKLATWWWPSGKLERCWDAWLVYLQLCRHKNLLRARLEQSRFNKGRGLRHYFRAWCWYMSIRDYENELEARWKHWQAQRRLTSSAINNGLLLTKVVSRWRRNAAFSAWSRDVCSRFALRRVFNQQKRSFSDWRHRVRRWQLKHSHSALCAQHRLRFLFQQFSIGVSERARNRRACTLASEWNKRCVIARGYFTWRKFLMEIHRLRKDEAWQEQQLVVRCRLLATKHKRRVFRAWRAFLVMQRREKDGRSRALSLWKSRTQPLLSACFGGWRTCAHNMAFVRSLAEERLVLADRKRLKQAFYSWARESVLAKRATVFRAQRQGAEQSRWDGLVREIEGSRCDVGFGKFLDTVNGAWKSWRAFVALTHKQRLVDLQAALLTALQQGSIENWASYLPPGQSQKVSREELLGAMKVVASATLEQSQSLESRSKLTSGCLPGFAVESRKSGNDPPPRVEYVPSQSAGRRRPTTARTTLSSSASAYVMPGSRPGQRPTTAKIRTTTVTTSSSSAAASSARPTTAKTRQARPASPNARRVVRAATEPTVYIASTHTTSIATATPSPPVGSPLSPSSSSPSYAAAATASSPSPAPTPVTACTPRKASPRTVHICEPAPAALRPLVHGGSISRDLGVPSSPRKSFRSLTEDGDPLGLPMRSPVETAVERHTYVPSRVSDSSLDRPRPSCEPGMERQTYVPSKAAPSSSVNRPRPSTAANSRVASSPKSVRGANRPASPSAASRSRSPSLTRTSSLNTSSSGSAPQPVPLRPARRPTSARPVSGSGGGGGKHSNAGGGFVARTQLVDSSDVGAVWFGSTSGVVGRLDDLDGGGGGGGARGPMRSSGPAVAWGTSEWSKHSR